MMRIGSYEKKLLWLLVAVVAIGGIFFGREFLSPTTFIIISNQLPEYGIITIALMMTLIVSGMNLSVVAMTTLSGVVGGLVMEKLSGMGPVSIAIGLLVMLVVGMLSGAVNGFIVSYLEVSPILTSLGTMLFYQGLSLNITKGGAITSFDAFFTQIGNGSFMGMPIPFLIFIALLVGVYSLLEKHEYGSQLYRIGKSAHSAIYSGIDIKKVVLLAYVYAGVITGVAAIVMTARYNSIRVDYGASYLISGILAVSLGGMDLRGGKGSIVGVVIALLIVSLIIRILNLAYVDASLIDGIMGIVLLMNIVVHQYSEGKLADNKSV